MINSKLYFKKIFIFLAFFLLFGCDAELKKEISKYQGDGNISYLKGQLLGISGVALKMPSFDISKPFEMQYTLTNIPKVKHYIIYLVVPEPCPLDQVLKGFFELQLFHNSVLVKKITANSLKDITNSTGGGENRFYFYEKGQFDVNNSGENWDIKIKSTNTNLSTPVNAHILISAGGYK